MKIMDCIIKELILRKNLLRDINSFFVRNADIAIIRLLMQYAQKYDAKTVNITAL